VKQFFLILLLAASIQGFSQSESAFFTALKNNDSATMESYLDDKIDFSFFEDQQMLNKSVAISKLKNFLSSQKVLSVEVIHKGSSKDRSSKYKVAKLTTSTDTYRVFVFSAGDFDAKSIKEIRIDKF
jgi:hypothetical protein